MKRYLVISFFSVCSVVWNLPGFASTTTDVQRTYLSTNSEWLVGLGLGLVYRNLNSSTTINNGSPIPAPYNLDTFTIGRPVDKALLSVFGGIQFRRFSMWLPYYSLVLRYEEQFQSTIAGQIQQYGLPQFINYNYSMKMSSSIVSLIGKLNLIEYKCVLPYVSAGIGVAFTRISDYAEQNIFPVNPARISPGFGKESTTNFAYSLGAGFDIILDKDWWFALGYEYLNLGKVYSGRGLEGWSNTQLNFGTLHTNTVFASISYVF